MSRSLQAGLLLLVLTAPVLAQDGAATTQGTVSQCSEDLFARAEESFRKRTSGSELLHAAERQLSEVVRLCKETPGGLQAEAQLRVLSEELAELNFSIARFYLSKFIDGKGAKVGARSRLEKIVTGYPTYSRFDEVLLLLGRLYLVEGKHDEAASAFRRLITKYPGSKFSAEASMGLLELETLKTITPRPMP